MEGFWGILKREMYYGHKFTGRDQICYIRIKTAAHHMAGSSQENFLIFHYPIDRGAQHNIGVVFFDVFCNAALIHNVVEYLYHIPFAIR